MMKKYCMRSMPAANCYVEINRERFDGRLLSVSLVSYTTRMLSINFSGFCDENHTRVWVEVYYPVDCSATTARHVNRFTTEFLGRNFYHDLKKLHLDEFGKQLEVTDCWYTAAKQARWYEQNGKQIRH